MASRSNAKPFPYQDLSNPSWHKGEVSVLGTKVIDLGIGHTRFNVQLQLQEAAALAAGVVLSWAHVTKRKGAFTITAYRRKIPAWETIAVASHTTGALPLAGPILAVELAAGGVTGAGNLRDTAAATTRDVRVVYGATGIPTLSFLAGDAVTSCTYVQDRMVADAVARNVSFTVLVG